MKKTVITLVFGLILLSSVFAQYYIPAWKALGVNPYRAHNVYVYGVTINGTPMQPSWEIGVFDEAGTLVGSIDTIDPDNGMISIRCSTYDGGFTPGSATLGDLLMFRLWDGTTEYIYPEMAVQFYEPPTAGPTPASVLYFEPSGSTHVLMLQYNTPADEFTSTDITVAPTSTYSITNLVCGDTGVTIVNGTLYNMGTSSVTDNIDVHTFDEISVDTYYNSTEPANGTVPVPNFSSYGWVIDPGNLPVFIMQPMFPLVFTIDLSAYGPNFSDPNDLVLYHRSIHGTSYFTPVTNFTYDPITQIVTVTLTSAAMFAGEYIIGSLNPEDVLPVELSSFTAVMNNSFTAVNLTWVTQSEENLVGYRIYRGDTDAISEAADQNTLIEATNTSQTAVYMYSDEEIECDHMYYYWLEAQELDGSGEYYGPIAITTPPQGLSIPEIPLVTGLTSLYPNPFNPDLNIAYTVSRSMPVQIDIVNMRGQLIKTVVQDTKDRGTHRFQWDGKDSHGRACSSGIYNIRMKAGDHEYFGKAILLK
jgi:hypothetical protein